MIFGVGFLMLPLLIHRLGKDATGLFAFATSLTGYFTAVELGIATSVTKYIAEFRVSGAHERINSMLRGSLLLMIAIGLLVAIALAAIGLFAGHALFRAPAVRGQAVATTLVAAATALLYWPSRMGTAMLEGLERYDQRASVAIVCTVLLLAGVWGLTFATHSVPVIAGWFGAMAVLEGAACAAIAWRPVGVARGVGSWRGRDLRPVLAFGGGLFIIGLADTAIYSLDNLILAAFVGAAAITVYQVALRPQTAVRMISALTAKTLVSTISRLGRRGAARTPAQARARGQLHRPRDHASLGGTRARPRQADDRRVGRPLVRAIRHIRADLRRVLAHGGEHERPRCIRLRHVRHPAVRDPHGDRRRHEPRTLDRHDGRVRDRGGDLGDGDSQRCRLPDLVSLRAAPGGCDGPRVRTIGGVPGLWPAGPVDGADVGRLPADPPLRVCSPSAASESPRSPSGHVSPPGRPFGTGAKR